MTERCHCTHNIQKRACQHKDFCAYIETLEKQIKDGIPQLKSLCEELDYRGLRIKELMADRFTLKQIERAFTVETNMPMTGQPYIDRVIARLTALKEKSCE